jgi:hypothetical protein
MLLSNSLLNNLRLTDTRETEVGLFLLLGQLVANFRPLNIVFGSVNVTFESAPQQPAPHRLQGDRVRALPSLGSVSSKFEATNDSAPDLLMLLSNPLLNNLRLTDTRETELGLFLLLLGQLVANLRPLNTVFRIRSCASPTPGRQRWGSLPSSLGVS